MNLNFIGKIYIVHHSASNIPVVYFRSEFLKELRVTTGHYVWLVMEAMVPGQIAPVNITPIFIKIAPTYREQYLRYASYKEEGVS